MANDKPGGPEAHKTAQIPKAEVVEGLLRSVQSELREMRSETKSELAEVRADIGTLVNEGQITNQRLTLVEKRQDEFESWRSRTSDRVRENTGADLQHEAQLAAEIVERKSFEENITKEVSSLRVETSGLTTETAKQTVILQKLEKLFSRPAVKLIVAALGYMAYHYLVTHGVTLSTIWGP